ncbi:HET-domain-containing protein [Annulohypoxylon bovei var. microspora]|nr:HET-domain-containing protein [Annulohypoxylon bovei var. microspora]
MSSYKYQPLRPNQIRVLEIEPSSVTNQVYCRLLTIKPNGSEHHSDNPLAARGYEALSYTWGDPNVKVPIMLDGCRFGVTQNLAAALEHLRLSSERRYIWVDALCINQDDEDERNKQVTMMRVIYQTAKKTIIWLGLETGESKIAMKLISDVANEETVVATSMINEEYRAEWRNVALLFDRPYWRRVWIRQEIILSREISVCCGHDILTWDQLVKGAHFLADYATDFNPIMAKSSHYTSGYYLVLEMIRWQKMALSGDTIPLQQLMLHLRQCECTDQRDKVYGALGLVSIEMSIYVDYGLDKVAAYTSATIAVIRSTNSLNILCECQNRSRDPGLPSWVPDLEFGLEARKLRNTEQSKLSNAVKFSAGGFAPPSYSFYPRDTGMMSLKTHGIIFDTISEVCSEFKNSDLVLDTLEEWRELAIKTSMRSWRIIPANRRLTEPPASRQFIDEALEYAFEGLRDAMPSIDLRYEKSPFTGRFYEDAMNRCFYSTKKHYIGLGPSDLRVGDLVAVLLGNEFPIVLRRQDAHYIVVGETYTPGIMKGEIKPKLWTDSLKIENLEIY